jgi:SNF2 family DNA or RNA helicase
VRRVCRDQERSTPANPLLWTTISPWQVLEHWKAGGHKALLFTQTQQMLDIMERCVQNAGMAYHRMDGSTNVAALARLVDDFNDNPDIFVFLLTTKVGGVGINLTGADRSVFFRGLKPNASPAQLPAVCLETCLHGRSARDDAVMLPQGAGV